MNTPSDFAALWPVTPSAELAERYGCTRTALDLRAYRMGLRKDPDRRKQAQFEAARSAAQTRMNEREQETQRMATKHVPLYYMLRELGIRAPERADDPERVHSAWMALYRALEGDRSRWRALRVRALGRV